MCQFNFIVTKEKCDTKYVREIAREYGLDFTEIKLNISNRVDIETFITTIGDCDCGSVFGSNKNEPSFSFNKEKEIEKLKRKKYSAAKIERIISEKQLKFEKDNDSYYQKDIDESENWLGFLRDLRLKECFKDLGVFYHQFNGGDIRIQSINIKRDIELKLEDLNMGLMKDAKEDIISWVEL